MNNLKGKDFLDPSLPNSFLAEQAILNIFLTNTNKMSIIRSNIPNIKKEAFFFEPHKLIYETIVELSDKNNSINLTTIISNLQDKGNLKKIGGIEKILAIINQYENFVDLPQYINLINEKYIRRLIIQLGKDYIRWGYSTSINLNEILSKIETSVFRLNQEQISDQFQSAGEIVQDIYEDMKKKKISTTGFNTSYKDFDAIVQGFQKSDLIIIAGRPSMGKTAFSLNLAKNIVEKYEIPLVIFTLEMSRQQIIYRFLSSDSKINSNRLKSGKMTIEELNELTKSMKKIAKMPIFIDDTSNLTLLDIRTKLKKIFTEKNQNGLVIIDYLQLMKLNTKLENRVQEISYITRTLKLLAKEFNVPIILLSQLSRNVESRVNKRPMLSDLRESGCFAKLKKVSPKQDADIVIMLYREDYYNQKVNEPQITEFIVAKHRNGPNQIRTGDTRIFNPLLYQLSYPGYK
eukprot:gene32-35_t